MATIVIDEEIERIEPTLERPEISDDGLTPVTIDPTNERKQRGLVERLERQINDVHGRIGYPWKSVPLAESYFRRGIIGEAELLAAGQFKDEFDKAHYEGLRAADMSRPFIDGARRIPAAPGQMWKDSVWRAICSIGGLSSPRGSCIWNVIGLDGTMKDWRILYSSVCKTKVSVAKSEYILRDALSRLADWYKT
jgi:hypothetical protein